MNYAQIMLKLYLDKLDIEFDMSKYSGRRRAQKAVYLGQMAGAEIGYAFGWYEYGPYSPELMTALLKLEDRLWDDEYKEYELHDYLTEKLTAVKDLMIVPENIDLSQSDWLVLVASVVYCSNEHKCKDDNKLKRFFLRDNGKFSIYFDDAITSANKYNLLNNKGEVNEKL